MFTKSQKATITKTKIFAQIFTKMSPDEQLVKSGAGELAANKADET